MRSLIATFWRWLFDPSPDPQRVSDAWRAEQGYGWRSDGRQ